jgi:hypothetical protein
MQPFYAAIKRFDSQHGIGWEGYIKWANIPSLAEVVSLDLLLCPSLLDSFHDDDWDHLAPDRSGFDFADLNYLLKRVSGFPVRNILGVLENPGSHLEKFPNPNGFEFLGYDLVENSTRISALTNCGGFPNSFSNEELNRFGLISNFERAATIKRTLKELNPDEPHANCELYAIWRLIEAAQPKT